MVTYWCSSAMQDCPSGSDLYIPERVVRRMLLNAQWVTLGGRRFMTCSFPSVPACKVMETAAWSRCQGHYQRKGLPAVAPSHRKLPNHPNKERHKCRGGTSGSLTWQFCFSCARLKSVWVYLKQNQLLMHLEFIHFLKALNCNYGCLYFKQLETSAL